MNKPDRYNDGHIRVTDSTVQVGNSTYAIRNISSIRMVREHLDLLALVIAFLFQQRPNYLLLITTNAGEVRLLGSKDVGRLGLIKDIVSMAITQYR